MQQKGLPTNSNHHFLPLNVLDGEGWKRLGQQYFAGQQYNIAVINEGLLAYLSPEEKAQMRDNIASFLRGYAAEGMWVSPDFTNTPYHYQTFFSNRVKKSTERKTERTFGQFSNREEIVDFLQQRGFQVEFPSNEDLLEHLTCMKKMHYKPELIWPILRENQACVARLA
jgi:O-methyltransferase involved in polyketide biosynthesis